MGFGICWMFQLFRTEALVNPTVGVEIRDGVSPEIPPSTRGEATYGIKDQIPLRPFRVERSDAATPAQLPPYQETACAAMIEPSRSTQFSGACVSKSEGKSRFRIHRAFQRDGSALRYGKPTAASRAVFRLERYSRRRRIAWSQRSCLVLVEHFVRLRPTTFLEQLSHAPPKARLGRRGSLFGSRAS